MKHIILGTIAFAGLLFLPIDARAQITGSTNPGGYAPNMYNRQAQPLSPYLNLLRGGNAAVNYFYGVRPGTQPSAFTGMFAPSSGGMRQTFFPVVDTLADLSTEPQGTGLAPTGHPVGFANTLGYFGPTSGQTFARSAQQQGPQRRSR